MTTKIWCDDWIRLQFDLIFTGRDPMPLVSKYHPDWKSRYDPVRHTPRAKTPASVPDITTLPNRCWVVPRVLKGTVEETLAGYQARRDWIALHNARYHECQVLLNNVPTWVWLFKKPTHALLFKLAWG